MHAPPSCLAFPTTSSVLGRSVAGLVAITPMRWNCVTACSAIGSSIDSKRAFTCGAISARQEDDRRAGHLDGGGAEAVGGQDVSRKRARISGVTPPAARIERIIVSSAM